MRFPYPTSLTGGNQAAEVIQRVVDPDANIIFGMVTDMKMENEIKLIIIATGFPTSGTVADREDQISAMLRDALSGDESELDVPPFLRRHIKPRKLNPSQINSIN